jgi:hypothetical protein
LSYQHGAPKVFTDKFFNLYMPIEEKGNTIKLPIFNVSQRMHHTFTKVIFEIKRNGSQSMCVCVGNKNSYFCKHILSIAK